MPANDNKRRRTPAILIAVLAACAATAALWFSLRLPVPRAPISRIAVLPFADAGGSDAYYAEGFSEELISRLSTIRGLRVIARSSAFRQRDAETGAADVARRLDAGSIVRGSVRRDGDTLDIRVRLSGAEPGEILWSGEYRRAAGDFFDVQADIAERIAVALNAPVGDDERDRLRKGGTRNHGAVRCYLQGRDAFNRGTGASTLTAAGHFTAALALDPSFAAAYAGLAECYAFIAGQGYNSEVRDTAVARSKRSAIGALELEPSLAEAHATLAYARFRFEWNFGEAEAGFRRAIELKQGLAKAHEQYALLLALLGRQDEALAGMRTAAELDPLSADVKAGIGTVLYYKKEYDASIEQFRRALKADPSDVGAHLGMAKSCVAAGRYHEAVEAINEALRLSGEGGAALAALGYAYAKRGDRGQAIEILDRFRRPGDGSEPSPFLAAVILRGLGSDDDALSFLEKAYEGRDARLLELGVDPAWDGSRNAPRFSALLEKIGLPD
jgi:TolB-like protein/Tfp pilus assembly protein PilF